MGRSRAFPSVSLATLMLATSVAGQGQLNGFPASPYDPFCAMSCLRSLSSLMLDCSSMGQTIGMMTMSTTSDCWASNTPYLTSLAWCMHTKCAAYDVPKSKLEWFWETEATGQTKAGAVTVPAKWSYAEALAHVVEPVTVQLKAGDMDLNATSIVSPDVYLRQWNVLTSIQRETTIENAYGIVMLVTGFGLPIVLTLLGYLPFISTLFRKLRPYAVWPSTIGSYQVRPLPYLIGNAPTVGQALYVVLFLALNIIFTCIGYQSRQPSAWYASRYYEILSYVMYRTGVFGYILAPLVFLLAGRNNFLLWTTNWSHSTFIILHRWVARIFALQSLLHSVLALYIYKKEGMYEMEVVKPYWIWGIVATVAVVILTFGSQLFVRSFAYEVFLISHIVFSVVVIVGFWYHAYDLYKWLGGYQTWIYCIIGVWFFDRLMRVARVVVARPRRAKVTELGGDYVRIDVPGIRWGSEPGKHVYAYFPTLHPLRPWENHPFSVLSTVLLQPAISNSHGGSASHDSIEPVGERRSSSGSDVEKNETFKSTSQVQSTPQRSHPHPATAGLTMYVRKSAGATKLLAANDNLLTFLEGPYPNSSTKEVLRCDRLLLISGGIGVTGLLPFVNNHWNVKLAWSVKESARCLVDDLQPALDGIADKDIRIGRRLDIKQLLDNEVDAGWERVGVVVSGPGGLCDDVRALVVAAARRGNTVFELEVEAYSW
ncbi:Ferric/cupric reductase transmembrane component [Drechslerella dactyloides]|uniref:Ferric/cupric reductase transmembrane component n=1 Tax=Drechslerella dactyloides TaxID=74499 RepID=A0AAD6NFH4_DREDA|nr:Ferric/cupric reductase transmembrane component [Drechslerella dactyloides]